MGVGSWIKEKVGQAVGSSSGLGGVINTLNPIHGATQMLADLGDPVSQEVNGFLDKNDPLMGAAQDADQDALVSMGMAPDPDKLAAEEAAAAEAARQERYRTGYRRHSGANKITLGATPSTVTPEQQANAANEYASTWAGSDAPSAVKPLTSAVAAAPAAPAATPAAAPTTPMSTAPQSDADQYSAAWFGNSLTPGEGADAGRTKTTGVPEMGRRLGFV